MRCDEGRDRRNVLLGLTDVRRMTASGKLLHFGLRRAGTNAPHLLQATVFVLLALYREQRASNLIEH
jgi:hypothetical protein